MSTVLTIGAFDGVHRGHAALLEAARRLADEPRSRGHVIAATFDPHPSAVLRPGSVPPRLSSLRQRRAWLKELGADQIDVLTPERALLDLSPEQFADEIARRWNPSWIVEGLDFHFGKGRAGSVATLRELGASRGFAVEVIEPVDCALRDQTVVPARSSMIRWLLGHGRVEDAAALLGRAYELDSIVVRGEQRGRHIGFPTANLQAGTAREADTLLPADGVYSGEATLPDGQTCRAAISVGTKPTFGSHDRLCEVHLLEHDGPLDDYGWSIRVRFERWLRDQIAYPNLEALLRQMGQDVTAAMS